MAFRKTENPRGLELTSLIDVVFLLLIFFLVSFAFSLTGSYSKSRVSADVELPTSDTETAIIKKDELQHLMIEVTADSSEGQAGRTVYILWPGPAEAPEISRRQALEQARLDSTFARFPPGYLSLPKSEFAATAPCMLISRSIAEYIERGKETGFFNRALVEVRAEKSTEFKILNFIMEQCSAYQDDIPQLVLRTRPLKRSDNHGV